MYRMKRIINPLGESALFEYNTNGQRTALALPNGDETLYSYDALGRITGMEAKNSAGAVITDKTYEYDALGSRTAMTDELGQRDYGYDELNRLVSAVYPHVLKPVSPDEGFTYDGAGNRLTGTLDPKGHEAGAGYSYDDANRLLETESTPVPGGWPNPTDYTFEHDADGNMTSKTDKSTGEKTEYIYNGEDQLIEVRKYNSSGALTDTFRYYYDVLGRGTPGK